MKYRVKLRGHRAAVTTIKALVGWMWVDVFLDLRSGQVWTHEKSSPAYNYCYKSPDIVLIGTWQGGSTVHVKDIHNAALSAYESADIDGISLGGMEDEPAPPIDKDEIRRLVAENVRKFMEEKKND